MNTDAAVGGNFAADYLLFLPSGLAQYGSAFVNLPQTDSDGNGFPDFTQVGMGVNSPIDGIVVHRYPFPAVEHFTGVLSRSSGVNAGNYSVSFVTGQQINYTGKFQVLQITGNVAFSRMQDSNTMVFNILVNGATRSISATGVTFYNIVDEHDIYLPSTTFNGTDGLQYVSKPTTLKRTGIMYSGNLEFLDGDPETTWPDYTSWTVTIKSALDSDGNGVPDISDDVLIPPQILINPQDFLINKGYPFSLLVSAYGTKPFTYQWRKNGFDIPGETGATLVRPNPQPEDSGVYQAVVSNAAGTSRSSNAVVVVKVNEPKVPVIAGPKLNTNNGVVYCLLGAADWPTAAAAARDMGGYLATVPDQETQDWIFGSFDGNSRHLWIGLNDRVEEGHFVWESGSMSSFRNWQPGQPDNCCGGENYVGILAQLNRWNDYGPPWQNNGVVEIIQPIESYSPNVWPPTVHSDRDVHYFTAGLNLPPQSPSWLSNSVQVLTGGDQVTTTVGVLGIPALRASGPYMNVRDKGFRAWADHDVIDILMLEYGNTSLLSSSGALRDINFLIGSLPEYQVESVGSLPAEIDNLQWNWVLFRLKNRSRPSDGGRLIGTTATNVLGDSIFGGVNGGTIRLQFVTNLFVAAIAIGERGAFGEPYMFSRFSPSAPKLNVFTDGQDALRIEWPAGLTNWSLESSSFLGSQAAWIPVIDQPLVRGATNSLNIGVRKGHWFRLEKR